MTFPFPTFMPHAAKLTRTFTHSAVDGSALTTYTFASAALGTATADRRIIVCAIGRSAGSRTVSSITVAGNTMTLVANAASNDVPSAIGIYNLTAGTTGDIVVTFSGSMSRAGIAVYAVYGMSGSTAFDTDTYTADGDPVTLSLDVPGGGVAVAIAHGNATSAASSWTNLTEDFDSLATHVFTGASGEFAAAQTALSIQCDFSGTANATGGAAASFGP